MKKYDWNVVFGRIYQDGKITLSYWDVTFQKGDRILVVGSKEDIDNVIAVLGKEGDSSLIHDRRFF